MTKAILFIFLGLSASASAIVTQDNAAAETSPAGLNWDGVYPYKTASGVGVGGNWLLTAAHVADDPGDGHINIGGTDYYQQRIVTNAAADLALIEYDKALPYAYSLFTGNLFPAEKLSVVMVGYGATGIVDVVEDEWTDSGTGGGIKRWGSQLIDIPGERNSPPLPNGIVKTTGFWMHFDVGSTTNEAGTGVGDSGGGVFYNDSGTWKLTGILTSRSTSVPHWSTFAASMPEYAGWVATIIPEPAIVGMLGVNALILVIFRSLRRRENRIKRTCIAFKRKTNCDSYTASKASQQLECVEHREREERWFREE